MPINSALPSGPYSKREWSLSRPEMAKGPVPKFDRTGRPSITKTERPRSANQLQMPRGLMCKLRQRGREYGGPAGSRGIDPSLQPFPLRSNCWGRPLCTGGIPTTRPRHSGYHNSGPVGPACDIGVALFGGLFCTCEWPISASTPNVTGLFRPLVAQVENKQWSNLI
jgi:hypothetical protein